jgi:hypothetical protein
MVDLPVHASTTSRRGRERHSADAPGACRSTEEGVSAVQPIERVGMLQLGRELLATKGGPIIFTEYS